MCGPAIDLGIDPDTSLFVMCHKIKLHVGDQVERRMVLTGLSRASTAGRQREGQEFDQSMVAKEPNKCLLGCLEWGRPGTARVETCLERCSGM